MARASQGSVLVSDRKVHLGNSKLVPSGPSPTTRGKQVPPPLTRVEQKSEIRAKLNLHPADHSTIEDCGGVLKGSGPTANGEHMSEALKARTAQER